MEQYFICIFITLLVLVLVLITFSVLVLVSTGSKENYGIVDYVGRTREYHDNSYSLGLGKLDPDCEDCRQTKCHCV
jgi:hypothetical protein